MRCAIVLAAGFEDCEAMITIDILRRAKVSVDLVAEGESLEVLTSHGVRVMAEKLLKDTDLTGYDVLILPGGKLGTQNLEANDAVKDAVTKQVESGKLMCAICAAPSILGHLGLLKGRKYTCFPGFDDESYGGSYQMELAVQDGNVITGRGMGATIEYVRMIVKNIAPEALYHVAYGIQYEHRFRDLKQN